MRFPLARPFPLAAAALALLGGAGCSNIHNDRVRTQVEGTTAGAATGGVLGGIIGGLVSMGSPTSIAQGALVGAAMGGGAGYQYATSVADKKAQYANEEAWLDGCIAEVKETAGKSRDYNAAARRIIAGQQRQLATLLENGKVRPQDRVRAEDLRVRIDHSQKNVGVAIQTWDHILEAHRRVVQGARSYPQARELDSQVQDLGREQDGLREDFQTFATMSRALNP